MSPRDFRRCLLTVFLFFFLPFSLLRAQSGQKPGATLTGRVFDETQNDWMVAAGVKLLNPKDSTLIKGALTDRKGRFSLSGIDRESYLLQVSFVGYEHFVTRVTLDSDTKDIGRISLKASATVLQGVKVEGKAAPVVMKTDTVQFNADAFRTRQNASVEDLLRKIPGVEINDDGKISYNGEAIERIELDGRDFFSSNPTMATRNLPSSMIRNVQFVDKKSDRARLTGMDDGEREKVLNLTVKEDKKRGFLANTSSGYGTQKRYKLGVDINYFDGDARYTLLGNLNNTDGVRRGRGDRVTRSLGFNYDNVFNPRFRMTAEAEYNNDDNVTAGTRNTQRFLGERGSTFESQSYNNFSNGKSAGTGGRLEWTPSERTILIAEPSFRWSSSFTRNENLFSTKDDSGSILNQGQSLETNSSDALNAGVQLHFRHTFNDLGRNLYVQFGGSFDKSDGRGNKNSKTDFSIQNRSEVIDQLTTTDDVTGSYGVSASYLEPFNKSWALQLNYRLNAQNRENNRFAYNPDASGDYTELDTRYSRSSTNSNMVHRMGLQLRYSFWQKSNIYLGIDAMPTTTHTTIGNGKEVTFDKERTVWNYAPAFTVDIRPTDTLRVMLRYNGRTAQPSMMQLNDVPIINSPLSTTVGNPNLLPSFTHSLRTNIQIQRRMQRQSFGLFGMANFTNNAVISRHTIDRSTGAGQNSYENVDGLRNIWFGFSANTPIGSPRSKWSSFTFGNFSYNRNKAFVNDLLNTSDALSPAIAQRITWNGDDLQVTTGGRLAVQRVHNTISKEIDRTTYDYNIFNELVWELPYDLSLFSRFTFQDARGYNDDFKRRLWLWDTSLSWSFLKDKNASLELSVYDLLHQRTTYSRTVTANNIIDQNVDAVTSYFMLTFTYHFNNFGGFMPRPGGSSREGRGGRGGRFGGGGFQRVH